MKKYYVKSLPEYEKEIQWNEKDLLKSIKKLDKEAKLPTYLSLEKGTIQKLKVAAKEKGVNYQTLAVDLIKKGLRRSGKNR